MRMKLSPPTLLLTFLGIAASFVCPPCGKEFPCPPENLEELSPCGGSCNALGSCTKGLVCDVTLKSSFLSFGAGAPAGICRSMENARLRKAVVFTLPNEDEKTSLQVELRGKCMVGELIGSKKGSPCYCDYPCSREEISTLTCPLPERIEAFAADWEKIVGRMNITVDANSCNFVKVELTVNQAVKLLCEQTDDDCRMMKIKRLPCNATSFHLSGKRAILTSDLVLRVFSENLESRIPKCEDLNYKRCHLDDPSSCPKYYCCALDMHRGPIIVGEPQPKTSHCTQTRLEWSGEELKDQGCTGQLRFDV